MKNNQYVCIYLYLANRAFVSWNVHWYKARSCLSRILIFALFEFINSIANDCHSHPSWFSLTNDLKFDCDHFQTFVTFYLACRHNMFLEFQSNKESLKRLWCGSRVIYSTVRNAPDDRNLLGENFYFMETIMERLHCLAAILENPAWTVFLEESSN